MSIETALCTSERIAQIIGSIDKIATLPQVTSQIISTINNPKSTASELHKIISNDPALVSQILKVANSSLYRRRNEIDSVERAIVLLGFDAVYNIAVTATLGGIFKSEKLCDDFTARDLWLHCVAVAATAREMGKMISRPLGETAFLAGLVHDVGLLVELQVCGKKLRKVCEGAKSASANFTALEYDIIGCDHEELGAALAQKWGFPAFCKAAAGYHHHPALAEPEYQQITGLIYAADTICCEDGIGFNLTANQQLVDTVAFEGLVPMEVIERTRENLPQLIGDAILMFS